MHSFLQILVGLEYLFHRSVSQDIVQATYLEHIYAPVGVPVFCFECMSEVIYHPARDCYLFNMDVVASVFFHFLLSLPPVKEMTIK